jgi:non-specific serine/threonine protein kinase/serine/threonine-protein kinase
MSLASERALFEACVELSADARAAWLEDNVPDAALRERVARLLGAHDEAESGRGFPAGTQPADFLDRRIGPYRVLELIGQGAMGEVYLAEQTAPVVRRVALKIIKLGMDTREVIARFEVERQTLAIMSHPSIAQILDAGATSDGRPYFVMEYVPGVPLTEYCDTRRLDLRARLLLFLEICDGVQHAHHKGVIHRDLKPSNLLVTERDGRPVPKIIDFGVAKATAPGQHPSDAHTRLGHLVGTPEYMSPEQAQASPLDVDTRSDVYSLGVVLYELLVGALPYRVTGDSATPAQVVRELLASDIRAPSQTLRRDPLHMAEVAARLGWSARQVAGALRGDLDWITLKALEKNRNRRYASVAEFAADLRRHLTNEPVLAGPPSTVYRVRKFVTRHRAGVAALAGLFIATSTFGTFMAFQARELARERDQAQFQAARAEASNEFMSLMLEEVGPGGQPLTMVELLDAGVGLLDQQYRDDPRFVARMLLQISRRYMDLQNTTRQDEILARAEAIARSVQDDELLARTHCAMVQTLLEQNQVGRAEARLTAAKAAWARVADPPLELKVDCLRAEADILQRGSDRLAARPVLEEARNLLEQAGATRGLAYTATLTDLGALHFRAGKIKEALEFAYLTRDAFERNGRGGTFGMIMTISNMGQAHYRLGEARLAEELGRQALEKMQAQRAGETAPPALAVAYAITLIRLGRAEEAEPLLAQADAQARSDTNQYMMAQTEFQRGRALLDLGRHAEAESQFAMAEEYWRMDPVGNQDRLMDLEHRRAELALASGLPADARTRIESVLAAMEARRDSAGLAAALRTAARIEIQVGSAESAERLARTALELATATARDPAQSADVGEALLLLGLAQRAGANLPAARDSLEKAIVALTNGLGAEHRLTLEARDAQQTPADVIRGPGSPPRLG